MNTHESYVSLETSKLLKEAGFKWFINSAYRDGVLMHQGNLLCDNFNGKKYENAALHEFFSAPTLGIAQRWLREVKMIHILIYTHAPAKWEPVIMWIRDYTVIKIASEHSYEEALEAGIKKALETILEKGE